MITFSCKSLIINAKIFFRIRYETITFAASFNKRVFET